MDAERSLAQIAATLKSWRLFFVFFAFTFALRRRKSDS